MAHGRDSRIFQDMTVFDMLDAVFAAYRGQGKLSPAWRFDIIDRALYPRRSLSTQYQESDLAFAERLMLEEGLFHYFEHRGDAASPALGSHTLVVADHNGVFKPNAQSGIAFTQPGAVMKTDSIDRWRSEWRQQVSAEMLKTRSVGEAGGEAQALAWSAPQLQLSSPEGIAATTPASALLFAGGTGSITAGQDLNVGAQGNHYYAVKGGISLFTYGKAINAGKPNQETGLKLHAATGKLSSQSQSGETRLTADKALTVASVSKSIGIAASQHVLLTAQGAHIRLEGGNIEIHGPGRMEFKASMKEWAGPASSRPTLPYLPQAGQAKNFLELNYRWDDLQPMIGAPYKVLFDNGVTIEGKLDAHGFARLNDIPDSSAVVLYGEDERDAVPRKKFKPNQVFGARPDTDEEAQAILKKYLAQEDAWYKDNYFPDEIDEMMAARADADLEYDFHYDDYRYAEEDTPEDREAEKNYRERHAHDEDQA